jgi:hypothetical protein
MNQATFARSLIVPCLSKLIVVYDNNLIHHVSLADRIDDFKAFVYFSEHSVIAVKVFCGFTRMANKELRPAGIPSGMGHRKYTAIMVLILSR